MSKTILARRATLRLVSPALIGVWVLALAVQFSVVSGDAIAGAAPAGAAAFERGPLLSETSVNHNSVDDPAGVVARDVLVGESIALPDGLGMIIETGCWHCDGDTEALYRVVAKPTSNGLDITKIFEASSVDGNAYITSFAMRPDASEMVVAVCTRAFCGGLGFPSPEAEVTFYRSGDLGSSWQELGVSSEALMVIAVTNAGIVVGPGAGPDYSKVWLIEGPAISLPAELLRGTQRNGELTLWDETQRQVVGSDGRVVMTLTPTDEPVEVVLNANQPPLALWVAPGRPGQAFGGYYLTAPSSSARHVGLRLGHNWAQPVQWLDERRVLASVEIEGRSPQGFAIGVMTPSIVDMYSGLVQPIAGIAGQGPFLGRNFVHALFRLDAQGGLPGCLPVRDRWKVTAAVIDCVPANSLRPTGQRRYGDAREWHGVWLSDGHPGWVEAASLR
jgi:hypothetical protein